MDEDLRIIFSEDGEKQLEASIKSLRQTSDQLAASVDRMGKEMGQGAASMKGFGQQAASTSGALTGLARELGSVVTAAAALATVRESVTAFADFGQGLADLSSITGLTGQALTDMGEVARGMGIEVEGGATAALKAMEAIGSAKPELLESAEALTSVTKAANILAQASGDTLPQAAQNLTGIMNQFGAGAEQADRFINVLAAGSLAGAANITELAESMKQSGAIASAFNVSVEETTAALEALADKSIKGGEAGTALRNVLARMAATEALPKRAREALEAYGVDLEKVSDESLPFIERLREMAKVAGDTTAIVEIFGIENQAAAQILLNSTGRVEELTKAVTGTNTAYEQAKTRTATFKEQLKRLGREFLDLAITVGEALQPIVSGLADIAKAGADVIRFFIDNKAAAIALAGAVALLNSSYITATVSVIANRVAVIASNVAFAAQYYALVAAQAAQAAYAATTATSSVAVRVATTAVRLFNMAIVANPVAAIAVAVTALGIAMYALANRTKELTREQKLHQELSAAIGEEYGKQIAQSDALFSILRSETATRESQNAALKELNESYGKYLPSLLTEKSSLEDVEAAQLAVNAAILQEIRLQVQKQKLTEITSAGLARQFELANQITKSTGTSAAQIQRVAQAVTTNLGKLSEQARAEWESIGEEFLSGADLVADDNYGKLARQLQLIPGLAKETVDALKLIEKDQAASDALFGLVGSIALTQKQLEEVNGFFNDTAVSATKAGEAITDTAKKIGDAVAAAGSIDALKKRIEDLQKAMDATADRGARETIAHQIELLAIQLERLQSGPVLDLVKPEQVSLLTSLTGEISNSVRSIEEIPAAADTATASLTTMGKAIQLLGEEGFLSLKQGLADIKNAFIDFGATAAQSIGYAIGSAGSAVDAFKEAFLALLVEVPKLAGMALLNAAAFPANAAIALPLAAAGLALLGLSGIIKGLGDRKKNRDQETDQFRALPEMGAARPGVSGWLGGFMSSMESRPINISLTAEVDGVQLGGMFKRVTQQHDKLTLKGK